MGLSVTTSRNTRVIDTFDGKAPAFPILSTNVMNAGDLVCWDHSGGLSVMTPTDQADMAYYMGVADQQNIIGSGLDGSATILGKVNSMIVNRGGIFWFYATSGETYTPLQPVYFNETLSVQTVTNNTNSAARSVAVGLYFPDGQQVSRGGATNLDITAGSTTVIPVWITPLYPVNPNTGARPVI